MNQNQAKEEPLTAVGGDAPDFLATIEPKTAHSYLLHWLQSGDIVQYYEDNPAARDALEAALQESTRPTLQPVHDSRACSSDIPGDAASVASKYSAPEYENSSGYLGQNAIHDQGSPDISTQSESVLPDCSNRDMSVGEQGTENRGHQTNLECGEKAGTE